MSMIGQIYRTIKIQTLLRLLTNWITILLSEKNYYLTKCREHSVFDSYHNRMFRVETFTITLTLTIVSESSFNI